MSAASGIRERYTEGGLLGTLTPGARPAIVVVDLQYGFTEAGYRPGFDLDAVVENTRTLLDTARCAGIPVWFSTIAFPEDGGIGRTWLRKMPALTVLREGDRSVRIDERLAMRDDEHLVVKQTASAFAGTALAAEMAAAGVDTLVVAGATTSGCVRATVVDACAADLPTFVVRECVGDRETAPHDAALFDIDAKYGDVVSLDQALSQVRGLS
ncbi:isochorismatase family protein [Rhodococcus sp. HNM0569]|uniref:isochorismatase family protein n=1 Tax=Rhodococcus sp. HNM0569 TaxID=2716340 RepID=UPI001981AAE1|nr:isochorismatase family protein [Rhodococcus sp. HNM0569]